MGIATYLYTIQYVMPLSVPEYGRRDAGKVISRVAGGKKKYLRLVADARGDCGGR
jgi:hypothetical protein